MDFSVSYIFGEAWDLTKKHFFRFVLLQLFMGFVGLTCSIGAFGLDFWSVYFEALQGSTRAAQRMAVMAGNVPFYASVIPYLLDMLLMTPLFAAIIASCRGVQAWGVEVFNRPLTTYLKVLAYLVAYFVIVILGLLLLIVPGIYLGVRLYFGAFYLVENKEASLGDAFSWAWRTSKEHVLELIGLSLVSLVLCVMCGIAFALLVLIGALVGTAGICIAAVLALIVVLYAYVLVYLAMGMTYISLSDSSWRLDTGVNE